MRIDLIWLATPGTPPPKWESGRVRVVAAVPAALAAAIAEIDFSAAYVLFWDGGLGLPEEMTVLDVAGRAGDVWHGGLRLGMAGLPRTIHFVDPVWTFNCDPQPDREATSWRLSLRACLVRASVLFHLGGPDPHFISLDGASLELGHRWIRHGAMMRHVPDLMPSDMVSDRPIEIPLEDEFRFLRLRYGRLWTTWAFWRSLRRGVGANVVVKAYRQPCPPGVQCGQFLHATEEMAEPLPEPDRSNSLERFPQERSRLPVPVTVSVLIPTLDRYSHLFNLLDQLRTQTVAPLEIIVIDQTAEGERDPSWPERFPDLPLIVSWRDQAGQCSSRNAGLALASGETVLFLDDDDQIPPDLIERHLFFIEQFGVDASCGVAEEVDAEALPEGFRHIRESDVFPTNNTLLKTKALVDSGLFDLAYERGERADKDLGMRLYLSGKRLGLNPLASVIHLHVPRGGLRQHQARVITRSASRGSLNIRHLLAPTEGYLWNRFFTEDQVQEALLIRTVGSLRGNQTGLRRYLRSVYMLILLPDTWRKNRARLAKGRAMCDQFPQIPKYRTGLVKEHGTL